MDERSVRTAAAEHPGAAQGDARSATGPAHLADPRALTILTTEHWSLLSARSLVYNEAFARAGMFLTFLTGSLVALGFVAQGSGFGREFLAVAAAILGFDLLIGLVTLGRIVSATAEEFRALQAMARLRHAYLEMVPTLERYLSAGRYDDLAGVLEAYGAAPTRPLFASNLAHGLTTAPGMVGIICSVVGGALVAALLLLGGASAITAIAGAVAGVTVVFVAVAAAVFRSLATADTRLEVRFPRPGAGTSTPEP